MKRIFFIFYILQIFSFTAEYKYMINLSCENKNLIETVKLASFRFIVGKEKYNDIKIIDENGKECEVLGVDFLNNEMEIIFKPTNSINYKVFLGYSEKNKEYNKFKKGELLIDDYILPNSIKSGVWVWVEKPLNGIFSHTGNAGFSFHRISFPKQFPITSEDKVITYVFIEDENTEEIMVEIISRYRRHYYFSFGKDNIKIKSIKKEKIGDLPERGKWVKIEIPLLKIRERNLEGIGFYNDKGKVYWDMTSINEVPVKLKLRKVENLISKKTSYFDYEIEGPFKVKNMEFVYIKLDATLSSSDRYFWEIEGKTYTGEKIIVKLEDIKKEINILLKTEKNKEYGEFSHKIVLGDINEIKVNFDILPFENFVYGYEILYIPVKIENLSAVPIKCLIKSGKNEKELYILPGKENGKSLTLPIDQQNEVKIKIYFNDIEIEEKIIKMVGLTESEYSIDGIFFKKGDEFIIFKIPEYSNMKTKEKEFFKIVIIGDFPLDLYKLLKDFYKEKRIEIFKISEEKYVNYLLNEFKFIQNILNQIDDSTFIIFFPFLNSLLRRHRLNEWEKVYDGMLWLLSQKTSNIILTSPFPSYPYLETFQPYREKLRKISEKRGFIFLDIYKIFSEVENGEKFFKKNEFVYVNLPNEEGSKIIFEEILKIMKNEKSTNN